MRINCNIDLAKAVRAGFNTDCREASVTIDPAQLTELEREALADQLSDRDGKLTWRYESLTMPTSDALLASIRRRADAMAESKREVAEREQAAREHAAAAVASGAQFVSEYGYDGYPCPKGYHSNHYGDYKAAYDAVPGVKEARAEARRVMDEKAAADRAAVEALKKSREDARALLADEIAKLTKERDGYKRDRDILADFISEIPVDALHGTAKRLAAEHTETAVEEIENKLESASPYKVFERDDDSDE